jgi:hypothetical protein
MSVVHPISDIKVAIAKVRLPDSSAPNLLARELAVWGYLQGLWATMLRLYLGRVGSNSRYSSPAIVVLAIQIS